MEADDFPFGARRATPDERAANERALARMKDLFPRLPKRDVVGFLINVTAFPFNSLIAAVNQAAELSRRAHKDVHRAYIISDRDIDSGVRYLRRKYPQW